MKKTTIFFAFVALFAACSKNNDSTQAPSVVISTPINNQVFTNGQTITVAAVVTDQDNISKVQLHVVNKSNSADVLHFEDRPNSKTYTLSKTFTAQTGITYKIEVEAVGSAGTESKVEIEVKGS